MITELKDRWITDSGVIIVDPESPLLSKLLSSTTRVRVTEITPKIKQYNKVADNEKQIRLPSKQDFKVSSIVSSLPIEYQNVDIETKIATLAIADAKGKSDGEKRLTTAKDELQWFIEHDKLSILRTLFYVVEQLTAKQVPWGVGRGSSVNSYILYLLGVHDIDPIRYNLNWHEFIRE